jgi:hypothetical protein
MIENVVAGFPCEREPATEAYRALEELKQYVKDLMRQRDDWITRYHDMAGRFNDYVKEMAFKEGEERC